MNNMNLRESAQDTVNNISYFIHLLKDKPFLVATGAIASSIAGRIVGVIPDHVMAIMALVVLVAMDWLCKRDSCLRNGIPFTSGEMRKKGVLKLRDYMLLYMAGAMTIPLMGDMWGYRSVLYFISICELWSIAENLNDAGRLPFDIRHIPLFDLIRDIASAKTSPLEPMINQPTQPPGALYPFQAPGMNEPPFTGQMPQVPAMPSISAGAKEKQPEPLQLFPESKEL